MFRRKMEQILIVVLAGRIDGSVYPTTRCPYSTKRTLEVFVAPFGNPRPKSGSESSKSRVGFPRESPSVRSGARDCLLSRLPRGHSPVKHGDAHVLCAVPVVPVVLEKFNTLPTTTANNQGHQIKPQSFVHEKTLRA